MEKGKLKIVVCIYLTKYDLSPYFASVTQSGLFRSFLRTDSMQSAGFDCFYAQGPEMFVVTSW